MTPLSKRSRRLAVPAIGLAAAILLSACSSGGQPTSSTTPGNFGGVKLTVWNSIDYDPYQTQQKNFFQTCAKQLGINVDVQTITANYNSKLLQAASSKSLPDIALLSTDVQVPELAAQGVLADLGSLGVSTAGQSSTVASLGKYKGTLNALPVQVEDYAIFYDKAAFEKAGITTAPTTFDEFVEDARKVTTATQKGVAFAGQTGDGSVAAYFLPWILSAGGNPSDTTNRGTIAAVNLYKQLVDDGSLSKEFVNWGWNATDQWTGGKAAITVEGPWELVDTSLKFKYATAPFPTLKSGENPKVGLLGYAYGVAASSDTKKEQAAAALVQCRASEANQVATALKGGYIPALTSAQKTFQEKIPAAKPFIDAVSTAFNPAKLGTKWNTLQNVYSGALQDSATNGSSAAVALKKAEANQ